MQFFLLNVFPVAAFITAYFVGGIYWATASLMVAQLVQLAIFRLLSYKISVPNKIMSVLVFLLGTITIVFHDARFIQIKPTIIYWLAAVVFLVTHVKGRNLPETILKDQMHFEVSISVWKRISISWVVSFFLLGLSNLYVVFSYSVDTWLYFKIYVVSVFLFLFCILQIVYLWHNRLSIAKEVDDERSE